MSRHFIQPYLFFGGRCEEALAFYQEALGAKVEMLMRFKENPDPMPHGTLPPGFDDKIMHCSLRIGESVILASDGMCAGTKFDGFSLALDLPTIDAVERTFAALSQGGKVQMPLGKTFWSPRFGMLTDRFGVGWMVGISD